MKWFFVKSKTKESALSDISHVGSCISGGEAEDGKGVQF